MRSGYQSKEVVPAVLNLPDAFDTSDQCSLLPTGKKLSGLSRNVLDWFNSYLMQLKSIISGFVVRYLICYLVQDKIIIHVTSLTFLVSAFVKSFRVVFLRLYKVL